MIKLEKLPPDILSRIPGAREALLEDRNVSFSYLFGGLPPAACSPFPTLIKKAVRQLFKN